MTPVASLRQMLTSGGPDQHNQVFEILATLQEPGLYSELLGDTTIDAEGRIRVSAPVPDILFALRLILEERDSTRRNAIRQLRFFNESTIPLDGLQKLTTLQRLELIECPLTTQPDFSALRALEHLTLTHNGLTVLPALPPKLRSLQIEGNLLQALFITGSPSLEKVSAVLCQIRHVALRLPRLKALNLVANQIKTLQLQTPALQTLHLRTNALIAIPEDVLKLDDLLVLDVARNQLTTFPVRLPPRLQQLDLSENDIFEIPDEALHPGMDLYIQHTRVPMSRFDALLERHPRIRFSWSLRRD